MFTRSKGKISQQQYNLLLQNKKKKNKKCDLIVKNLSNEEVIKLLHDTHPSLSIKKNDENINKYDELDKLYIKNVYKSLRSYGIDEGSESSDDDDEKDVRYFKKLTKTQKQLYIKNMEEIKKNNNDDIPLRFRVINANINIDTKKYIIRKINELEKMYRSSGEYNKQKKWIENLLEIPFDNICNLKYNKNNTNEEISNYLIESKQILDSVVYGHQKAKSQIIQIIAQLITNPNAIGNVFGIQGPMGNGKTTLLKDGLAKSLQRPFRIIQLGGATDSSYLNGHSYTYEGSQWGQIVDILMQTKCMNPIIYFDELDKVSQTSRGQEIIGILTHLTDPSQNKHFHDKYFGGIDIDLSKALIVFSFNDESKINKILLDRIYTINTKGYQNFDKLQIAKNFLIPDIMENTGFNPENIIFSDNIIIYIIQNFTNEEGVRQLKRCIEIMITRINLLSLVKTEEQHKLDLPFKIDNFQLPFTITTENINQLIDKKEIDTPPLNMYC